MEQVQLHQHAAVRGRRAGRAGRGDAHHDVSGILTFCRVNGVFKGVFKGVPRLCRFRLGLLDSEFLTACFPPHE